MYLIVNSTKCSLLLPGYMLAFMDFHTLYCRGPANRPSHRLCGVNAGFSNFSDGLPTKAKSEEQNEKIQTIDKTAQLFPHLPLEQNFNAL